MMASEVTFSSEKEAIVSMVKAVANASKYQDRWIADIDLEAAIRHEYGLWQSRFDAAVSYRRINAAVKSDLRLNHQLEGDDAHNTSKIFRKEYKPTTITTTTITTNSAKYTISNSTKKSTRPLQWYYFEGAKKVARLAKKGGTWYKQSGGVTTGDVVKNSRKFAAVTDMVRASVIAALLPSKVTSSSATQNDNSTRLGEQSGEGNGHVTGPETVSYAIPVLVPMHGLKSPPRTNKRERTDGQEKRRQKEFGIVCPSGSVYWKSHEARDLFGAKETETVTECLDRRIVFLEQVIVATDGWKRLLDDGDENNRCTVADQVALSKKAISVRAALRVAREKMPLITWDAACKEAAVSLERYNLLKVGYTSISTWNRLMRQQDRLPHPRGAENSEKNNRPPLFQDYPDHWHALLRYCKVSLKNLSVQFVQRFVIDVIRKGIKEGRTIDFKQSDKLSKEATEKPVDDEEIELRYGIKTWCEETVRRWMKAAGFKYSERKKHFYVDNHEHPLIVAYRKEFTERYLKRERRMYRWVQVPLRVAKKIEVDGHLPVNGGYRYSVVQKKHGPDEIIKGHQPLKNFCDYMRTMGDTISYMVEYHVDESKELKKYCTNRKYGGDLSVRMLPCERVEEVTGQDEVIFKQYLFTKKGWSDPNGTMTLIPKDEGQGLMRSILQNRIVGVGWRPTNTEIDIVNRFRREKRPAYRLEAAALKVNGSAVKRNLKYGETPFDVNFEYGASKEGYWSVEHMLLQLEDCLDCLQAIFPWIYHVFLTDHSCGHDRRRDDALCVSTMNVEYGGKQAKMRVSENLDHTCIGSYDPALTGTYVPRPLTVRGSQAMVFPTADDANPAIDGPYWMHESERI